MDSVVRTIGRSPTRLSLAALVVVCAVFVAETTWVRRTTSLTYDETFYLSCGLQTVHDGRLDARMARQGVAPLPILCNYVLPLVLTGGEHRADPWQGTPRDRWWIRRPRLTNALSCGLPLILVVYLWLLRWRGRRAAACGAALVGLSPATIAHGAIAATDVCFTLVTLLALAAQARYVRAPAPGRLLLAAIATAAAMSAKYSGIFLVPVFAIVVLLRMPAGAGRDLVAPRWRVLVRRVAIVAVFVGLVLPCWWGLHGFSSGGPLKRLSLEHTPDSSMWIRLLGRGPLGSWGIGLAHRSLRRPAPFEGVNYQWLHDRGGRAAYLMGEVSTHGWWYYFPCAFAFKSTPAELALAALLAGVLVASLRRMRRLTATAEIGRLVLTVAVLVYAVMLLRSRVNLGHRYLLVLYPPLVILGVDRVCVALRAWPRALGVALTMLTVGQAASNVLAAPHFLSYFNRLAGGPARGRWLLVDSNLDWGQDLPALARFLRQRPGRPATICYFGNDVPLAYGVDAERLEQLTRSPDDYQVLAVSVTYLQGLYDHGVDPFHDLRGLTPDAWAGYSIAIFELDTPEERAAFGNALSRIRSSKRARSPSSRGAAP